MIDSGSTTRAGPGDEPLPWLEPVDDEDGVRAGGARKMLIAVLLVAVGIVLLVAVLFGFGRREGAALDGPPALIRAEPGPYKVKPGDPGGLDVAGDSGTAFATSAGEDGDAEIDLDAVPEAPIERPGKVAVAAPGPARRLPPNETREAVRDDAPAPPATAAPVTGGSGSVVQLGAFSSAAKAEAAWTALSSRFSLVAGMGKIVVPVRSGGATLYRLRAAAASPDQARQACRTLRVAGESCVVVN